MVRYLRLSTVCLALFVIVLLTVGVAMYLSGTGSPDFEALVQKPQSQESDEDLSMAARVADVAGPAHARPLFNVMRKPIPPPPPPPPVVKAPPKPKPVQQTAKPKKVVPKVVVRKPPPPPPPPKPPSLDGVRILGLMVSETMRAVLAEPNRGNPAELFREGDVLAGWTVADISEDGVVLRFREEQKTITLFPDER